MERLSESRVIAALAERGVRMTPKKLKLYRKQGHVERPQQVHIAGRRGSSSSYPASVVDDLERLERAGQSKGVRRSASGRAFLVLLTAPTADVRKSRLIVEALRAEMESVRSSTELPALVDLLFNPPNSLDARYDDRLDEAYVQSEFITKRYRKDVQPLIEVAADMTLAGDPIKPVSIGDRGQRKRSNSAGIISDALGVLPSDARPSELLRASYLVNDDDLERALLLLRRAYFIAKNRIRREDLLFLETFAPLSMLKKYFGSIDACFVKMGPGILLWLANQYRNKNDAWLKPIEAILLSYEQGQSSPTVLTSDALLLSETV